LEPHTYRERSFMSALDEEASQVERLEARVAVLERHVQTLAAATDAASRLRIASGGQDAEVSVTGGEWVRHILEKGGLVGEPAELAGRG
jgi:hypothetical protein